MFTEIYLSISLIEETSIFSTDMQYICTRNTINMYCIALLIEGVSIFYGKNVFWKHVADVVNLFSSYIKQNKISFRMYRVRVYIPGALDLRLDSLHLIFTSTYSSRRDILQLTFFCRHTESLLFPLTGFCCWLQALYETDTRYLYYLILLQ